MLKNYYLLIYPMLPNDVCGNWEHLTLGLNRLDSASQIRHTQRINYLLLGSCCINLPTSNRKKGLKYKNRADPHWMKNSKDHSLLEITSKDSQDTSECYSLGLMQIQHNMQIIIITILDQLNWLILVPISFD